MKKSKLSGEQITYALRQVDSGTPVADVRRQLGVSEASLHNWCKRYGQLDLSEVRQLRNGNARIPTQ